jgi:hypothetical protein
MMVGTITSTRRAPPSCASTLLQREVTATVTGDTTLIRLRYLKQVAPTECNSPPTTFLGVYSASFPAGDLAVSPTNDGTLHYSGTLALEPKSGFGPAPTSVVLSISAHFDCLLPPGFTKSSISDTQTTCLVTLGEFTGCVTSTVSTTGHLCRNAPSVGVVTGTVTVEGELLTLETLNLATDVRALVGRNSKTVREVPPSLLN